ncbi:MAG: type II toxin-antitoxin system PemK/MazF family toxin [Actinomycetia bacterium]|nr:type II toxin-antitoxin system PemK/MazF family toxin [Actinomycetes bacterium]
MRSIRVAHMDKTRPAVVLTRDVVLPHVTNVTIAPITSTIRGLSTEVAVGAQNGLDHSSVISCDNITTVPAEALGRHIGLLLPGQEQALTDAICTAFDLE